MFPGENEISPTCKQIDIDAFCPTNAPAFYECSYLDHFLLPGYFPHFILYGKEAAKRRAVERGRIKHYLI